MPIQWLVYFEMPDPLFLNISEQKFCGHGLFCINFHYANTHMQYTAIFHGCKNVHFQMKICDIFLIFAQNIDCRYTLEPPQ